MTPGTELEVRMDGLGAALRSLDRLLEQAVAVAPSLYGWEPGTSGFRGLYITQEDACRLFRRSAGEPALCPADFEEWGSFSALDWLAERYGLDSFERKALLIALAPEIDLRYERIYAYLQDDVARRWPSVDLVLNLLCASAEEKLARRAHFAADAPLARKRLVHLYAPPNLTLPPLVAHGIKLDEQVVRLLLGQQDLDPRLAPYCRKLTSDVSLASLPLVPGDKEALSRFIFQCRREGAPVRLNFRGQPLPLKRRTAEAVAYELGVPLLAADLARLAEARVEIEILFREAELHNALLYLDGDAEDSLLEALGEHRGDVIVAGRLHDRGMVEVDFGPPPFAVRREQWRASLAAEDSALDDRALDTLAARYRLHPDSIERAVAAARNQARWRGESRPARDEVFRAARAQSGQELAALARKIEPVYSWEDIVLPAATVKQLREICGRVGFRHQVLDRWGFDRKLSMGKGVTALFAGPSGVGKTMAAEIIARELQLDLCKIDLAGVVSKYIGETEKNLDRIFTAAENANAILFFDEADALFGKRSEVRDSHDRYANIEISYLLQKMEMYDGVAILASNLRQNLDESFVRRLAFTIHFPFPDEAHRRRIWQTIWPREVPLQDDVDFDFLAARFKLSGGNIKNAALAAAFLAAEEGCPIATRHLVTGVQREYQKMSKPLGAAELGPYAPEEER